jgi:hypothetical protein
MTTVASIQKGMAVPANSKILTIEIGKHIMEYTTLESVDLDQLFREREQRLLTGYLRRRLQ